MLIQLFVEIGCGYDASTAIPELEELIRAKGYAVYTNETVPHETLEDAVIDLESK